MTPVVVVSAIFVLILVVMAWLLLRAWRRLDELRRDMTKLGRDLEGAQEELGALLAEVGGSRILIELSHPIALARAHSRWGGALAGLAPSLIRRRVYDTVARQLKERLAEQGVDARLQVFHPTGS